MSVRVRIRTWDQLCNTKSDVLLTWVLTDPWSISLEVNRGRYDDGPGISQRAAAARSQVTWRWLVGSLE